MQDFIESFQEPARPLRRVRDSAVHSSLEKMIFIGDIQRGENCQARTVNCVGLVGHRAHLSVNVFSELQNVFRIGSAQVIGLVEYLDAHTGVAGVLRGRMLCGGCHILFYEFSLPLALP